MAKQVHEKEFTCPPTCRVKVVICDGGESGFFEKIESALAILSSGARPLTVTNWCDHRSESVACDGFIIVSGSSFGPLKTEEIAYMLGSKLTLLVGTRHMQEEQIIFLLHEKETSLIESLCLTFELDQDDMTTFEEKEYFSFFSLTRDFMRSRKNCVASKVVEKERLAADSHEVSALLMSTSDEPSPPVVKTTWRVVVAENNKEFGEQLKEFLVVKAARQDICIEVDLRYSVEEALLALARTPFAISINPHLAKTEYGKNETWAGLAILPTAKEREVPVILRSSDRYDEIRKALRQQKILAPPTKIVPTDLVNQWAEHVLAQLMRRDH